ncbi:MAG: hypothetical protein AAGA80_16860 [Cyanobacteria bacterium P01_F01_bin.143]
MKFYPHMRSLFFLTALCLTSFLFLTYFLFQHFNLGTLLGSAVTFGLSLFFLVPMMKNQTVEITDEGLIVTIFGTAMTLEVQDLHQVLKRRNGDLSYRFEKGDFLCQITPYAYHDAEKLQEYLNRMFNLDKLRVEIIEETRLSL